MSTRKCMSCSKFAEIGKTRCNNCLESNATSQQNLKLKKTLIAQHGKIEGQEKYKKLKAS